MQRQGMTDARVTPRDDAGIRIDRRFVVLRRADRRLVRIGIVERFGRRFLDGGGIGRAMGLAAQRAGPCAYRSTPWCNQVCNHENLLLNMPKHYHAQRFADARLDYNGGFDRT